jgi:hypothetical protein
MAHGMEEAQEMISLSVLMLHVSFKKSTQQGSCQRLFKTIRLIIDQVLDKVAKPQRSISTAAMTCNL